MVHRFYADIKLLNEYISTMDSIIEIIKTMHTVRANLNPTEIYNEGWMTRLLVFYSIQEKIKLKEIDFASINHWTSEALISSPFVEAKKIREGYTHADMALGDFTVDYKNRGQLTVNQDAKQFGIIEAKMGSPLSQGTTHAPKYNQASRNVACIAHNNVHDCKTFFYVVAPASKIDVKDKNGIATSDLVKQDVIKKQIEDRFSLHNANNEFIKSEQEIIDKTTKCIVGIITYEEWIDLFLDSQIKNTLNSFYENCKNWNYVK